MSTAVIEQSSETFPLPVQTFGAVQQIPLSELHESPWNPRQFYPEAAMAELTQSMREDGFRPWLPIVVRPLEQGGYEIAAGHRRSRAAAGAGLKLVPCLVRPMDDSEFLDVLNFDNSGRENVHPLHEAAGWRAWMEKTGKGVLDIAAKIGQSKEYVYQRLKYAELIVEARAAFLEGKISAGHAILIARLPASQQPKALKACEPPAWDASRVISVRDLAEFIHRDIHLDLGDAAFDLESETLLPAAGACTVCPKRTKNAPAAAIPELQPAPGADEDERVELAEITEADQCSDPSCFTAKLDAHMVQIKTKLEAKGKSVIEVSSSYGRAPKGMIGRDDYAVVPKGPDATLAIVKDGVDAGKVIHIKILSDQRQAERSEQLERKKKDDLEMEGKYARERAVRVKILEAIREKVTERLMKWELGELIRIAIENSHGGFPGAAELCRIRGIAFDRSAVNQLSSNEDYAAAEALLEAIPALSSLEMFRLAVEMPMMDDFERYAVIRNDPPKKLLDVAASYKVDAVRIRRQLETEQKESEGGTQREVQKPAKAAPVKKAQAKKKPAPKAKPPAKPAKSKKPTAKAKKK